jgi:hypothetical protein
LCRRRCRAGCPAVVLWYCRRCLASWIGRRQPSARPAEWGRGQCAASPSFTLVHLCRAALTAAEHLAPLPRTLAELSQDLGAAEAASPVTGSAPRRSGSYERVDVDAAGGSSTTLTAGADPGVGSGSRMRAKARHRVSGGGGGDGGGGVARRPASARRFYPLRSIWTEIYLCHTSSCHETLRMETPGQGGGRGSLAGGAAAAA